MSLKKKRTFIVCVCVPKEKNNKNHQTEYSRTVCLCVSARPTNGNESNERAIKYGRNSGKIRRPRPRERKKERERMSEVAKKGKIGKKSRLFSREIYCCHVLLLVPNLVSFLLVSTTFNIIFFFFYSLLLFSINFLSLSPMYNFLCMLREKKLCCFGLFPYSFQAHTVRQDYPDWSRLLS